MRAVISAPETPPHDYNAAVRVAKILRRHGFEAYIIGGAVRDLWLGRHPKDFDLATNARPEQIMAIPEFTRSQFTDPAQAYGVTRVKFGADGKLHELEVATFRKDIDAHKGRKHTRVEFSDLEEDVKRRDLTVNALALDPVNSQLIDLVGGIDDLDRRVIRFIGPPTVRIKEDPLRLLRAVRFKNQLDFSYHPDTVKAIKRAVRQGAVEEIAVDRLRDELTQLLLHTSRRQAMLELYGFGILERVLPEVTAGKNVVQPAQFHAEGDVWQHQMLILDYLPDHPNRRLVWAALLHDIGKGPTSIKPLSPGGRIRFDRHYAVGAEMAKAVLRRLKFSNHDIKDITWMIYHHMSIDDLPDMRPSHQQRMLGHPAFEDLLELHRADAAASWRPGQPHDAKPRFTSLEQIWHEYQSQPEERRQPSLKRDLGIDGHWLMTNFGRDFDFEPGPWIGEVLRQLDSWYRDNGLKDVDIYNKRVRQLLIRYNQSSDKVLLQKLADGRGTGAKRL